MIRAVTALLTFSATAQAAPGPIELDDTGWRFANCQMERTCRLDTETCTEVPALGETYLWRDEEGLHIGQRREHADLIEAFDSISEATDAISPAESADFLVIPPETYGPGSMRIALLSASQGTLRDRFFQMNCDIHDVAPPPRDAQTEPDPDREEAPTAPNSAPREIE